MEYMKHNMNVGDGLHLYSFLLLSSVLALLRETGSGYLCRVGEGKEVWSLCYCD